MSRFADLRPCSVQFTLNQIHANEKLPDRRVEGFQDFITARDHHDKEVFSHYGGLFSRLRDRIFPYKPGRDSFVTKQAQILLDIITNQIRLTDLKYEKAKSFIQEYSDTGTPQSLIRLFTMESPFYEYINQSKTNSEYLAASIYSSLRFLHPRAFRGISYRGLSMSEQDLRDYRWAEGKPNHYLVTNTFCSTTRNIELASQFAQVREYDQRRQVLMLFEFSNRCFTAIQLEKLSDQLLSLSEIEAEQEVLILPRTIFHVQSIIEGSSPIVICLEYCSLDREVDDHHTHVALVLSDF